ncbi:hypothetical protein BDY19DRAFT_990484 [Irpex rosettiformis]|uniref:Uncharacterized protein n=1 Tax=Irpex rosettiformis TaxID=378272 RepID=A0ACB8UEY0_9APHY|nr:hypothetical protein BDY19DRAFT_990484 [Irpex rosettiformis]
MATLGYSSFFSSGLRSAEEDIRYGSRPITPDPTTPRPKHINLDETTPTAPTHTIPAASQTADEVLPALTQAIEISDSTNTQDRSRIRRRRSSLGLNASPVTVLKSNTPGSRASVTGVVQRQSISITSVVSPARSRSGSVVETGMLLSRAALSIASNDATSGNSIIGRMRSGSVGTALRPRRLRKQGTIPAPLPPPPASPLPDVPMSRPDFSTQQAQYARRPSIRRSHTSSASVPLPMHTPTMSLPPHGFNLVGESALETPGGVRGSYF